jgi:2-keto-4-pentenoate hydratase
LQQKVIWRQAPHIYKNEDRTFKDGPRVHFEDTAREYIDYINYYALAPPSSCIGWKVGLTAPVIQQQFGVHEPVFACLLAEGLVRSGHIFRRDALIEPGFENELCIVLDRDLPTDATRADVACAVARVYPAFEIIETRGDLSGQLALAITDNGQQKAFVLGEPVSRDALPELDVVTVRVRINGTEVATASGDAVLARPRGGLAPENQVRTGLPAGGRWIRTAGPSRETGRSLRRNGNSANAKRAVSKRRQSRGGDRGFESVFLHRRVSR